jgi:hypothetical protein
MRHLFNYIDKLPIITAACERGFSKMNFVCFSLRCQLSPENLAALMFVSLSGSPCAYRWNPLPYARTWLANNGRNATLHCMPEKRQAETEHIVVLASLWKFIQDSRSTATSAKFRVACNRPIYCVQSRIRLVVGCRVSQSYSCMQKAKPLCLYYILTVH